MQRHPHENTTGSDLPALVTPLPGPASTALVDVLARHECPAITARRARRAASLGVADTDPFVWETAVGANLWDADGNRLVDLTAGFGVATVGHRDPAVVAAAHAQVDRLLHAMGDAYPDVTRIRLLEALAAACPDGLDHAILGLSGADAVDAVVKTAVLATGRDGVLVFEGSYHGLSLGTVPLQAYKASFSDPFRGITHPHVHVLPFGCDPADVGALVQREGIGLVLVEPIQGRGGIRVPEDGWLRRVHREARAHGALVAHDEIQCGLGRTGAVWAGDVTPDLLAVGKALGGGFPLSAAVGTSAAMGAWGASKGEAIHTQTFLGHPVGCAAALAVLGQLDTMTARCAERGARLAGRLAAEGLTVQGRGLMLGVVLPDAYGVHRRLLARGYLALPAGMQGEVLALTPPSVLSDAQIDGFVEALVEVA
ncbi:MAG: aspartate aminotransferase family protein [Myxococcales bacterium]|nr:aspartate aminotransferase family protein [Myxococcales bacterium]MCB9668159.1 aspartate aminotransferase family protein [Alphaproteobacteria bacterium]MCB9692498.1 aspartate aminotransferase family protein [Alphaproteobacteria bacterium]